MSKKNSSVSLKNGFKDYKDLSNVFLNFKNKLNTLKKNKYVVAVSGGPDSLALVALTKAYNFFTKTSFYYVLIDHGIRKNSNQEAQKVKKLLKKTNINLKIFLNKKKIIKNIQAEARNTRYDILSSYCKKNRVQVLLTAHNLEDQVETFLIRLSRGSGLRGLSAMKTLSKINNQVSLFRPLLDTKKKLLIKISKNIFGTYFKDPSNTSQKYLRTKVRNLKKPLENSGIKYEQIFRSIQNLSLSKTTLDEYLNKTFKELIKKPNKEILINFNKYKNLSKVTKMALINESIKKLKKNYYDLRSKKVDNLISNIEKKEFKKTSLGGCVFFKKGKNLCLKLEKF
ncbi:MAG: tRNA lysidine(34) synthetase TilS [Candidatus Pelagibacter sp. TMED286]|nr:MAG: tRNA lysidine(34) synthetase TilS [Candidatus Pelagibacter sp. TMED286]|tara:strand:+ start:167 stop:1186 length:1020 start_codon:yes stop_codon:yes gene_type:complete